MNNNNKIIFAVVSATNDLENPGIFNIRDRARPFNKIYVSQDFFASVVDFATLIVDVVAAIMIVRFVALIYPYPQRQHPSTHKPTTTLRQSHTEYLHLSAIDLQHP